MTLPPAVRDALSAAIVDATAYLIIGTSNVGMDGLSGPTEGIVQIAGRPYRFGNGQVIPLSVLMGAVTGLAAHIADLAAHGATPIPTPDRIAMWDAAGKIAASAISGLFPPGSGADGEDGMPGPPGQPGLPGAQGIPGADGQRGEDGGPGPTGSPGLPGAAGGIGRPGDQGEAGEPGAPGQQGLVGQRGATGDRGSDGVAGEDGQTLPAGGAVTPFSASWAQVASALAARTLLQLGPLATAAGPTMYLRGSTNDTGGAILTAVVNSEGIDSKNVPVGIGMNCRGGSGMVTCASVSTSLTINLNFYVNGALSLTVTFNIGPTPGVIEPTAVDFSSLVINAGDYVGMDIDTGGTPVVVILAQYTIPLNAT